MNICYAVHAVLREYHATTLRGGLGYRLTTRGHKVYVVTNRSPSQPSFEVLNGGIKVFRVKARVLPEIRYPLTDMRELISMLKTIIREYDIDLIHYHPFEYPISWSAPLIHDVPKVISIEGVPGINWFYGCLPVDIAGLAVSITLGRIALSACSKVIVFGRPVARYVKALGVPEKKIAVIGYGVDEERFNIDTDQARDIKRSELGLSPDDIVVLFVGRLYPVKGIRFLLEAADVITHWRRDVRFLIVGEGSLRSLVEEVAKENPGIIFLGYRTDVPELMAASDIFVLPSLAEGLPYALLEAGFCGLPLIATNVGCVADVVIPGRTGILVPKGSSRELIKAIKLLIERPELRESMSEAAQKLIRQKYSWNHILEQYERLYYEVLEGL